MRHSTTGARANPASLMYRTKDRLKRHPVLIGGTVLCGWWLFVFASGQGIAVLGHYDFTTTGALGDSFGVVGAVAAVITGAIAFNINGVNNRHHREQVFFHLLEMRTGMARDLESAGSNRFMGRSDFLASEAAKLRRKPTSPGESYKPTSGDIARYLSFTARIITYAHDVFKRDFAQYMRYLIASSSQDELDLLSAFLRPGSTLEAIWREALASRHLWPEFQQDP